MTPRPREADMSKARGPDGLDVETVDIVREGEWFVATVEGTNLASQGKDVPEALENLAEVVALHDEGVPDDATAPEPDAPWFDG